MKYKTGSRVFVFDADGVAIDPWRFADALRAEYGISREETRDFFVGPFNLCLTGDANLPDLLPLYLERWNWPDTVEAFIDIWMDSDNKPNEQVLRRIQNLRENGACCYLASNQERVQAEYIRNCMDFESKFDRLFFSCDLGFAKPHRQFFDLIAAEVDCRSSNIHFWDDAESHVRAARIAGWNACLYENIESLAINL